ncbi:MAG: phosphate signaling complex protein PhoU [Egibacteraceae bacterium]
MEELRRGFHERLSELEDDVLGMGQAVLRMIDDVMAALVGRSVEQAEAVIVADEAVDVAYAGVQEGVLATLALEAPVASELRLVSALIHVSLHLERVGDLCVNIAKFVKLTESFPADPALMEQVQEMGEHAWRAIGRCMQSFARRDVALARELNALDDPLDRLNRGLFRRLVRLASSDEERLDWAFGMVLVARYLERIGDHAVDIGEQAEFVVTGSVGASAALD